ncbi:MAG: hypothetical protein ABI076_12390, partial [Acidobacteriaceae bacterium]
MQIHDDVARRVQEKNRPNQTMTRGGGAARLLGALLVPAVFLLATAAMAQQRGILTPPPSPKPHINGPSIYGVHPSHPLLYRIPATGDRPMRFSATQLPSGLKLDAHTGILRGAIKTRGEYVVLLQA